MWTALIDWKYTTKHEWIRNSVILTWQLMNNALKDQFGPNNLVKFWLNRCKQYTPFSSKSIKILLYFVTIYLFKAGWFLLAIIETKYQARFIVESTIKVALSITSWYFTLSMYKLVIIYYLISMYNYSWVRSFFKIHSTQMIIISILTLTHYC